MTEGKTKESPNQVNSMALPVSIIVAAVLIAGAWVYSAGVKNSAQTANQPNNRLAQVANTPQSATAVVKPVSFTIDHFRGNPNAPVKIVEYSDLECPFCKMFQSTLQQVLANYGDKVVWIYRNYPIDQLHPKSRTSSEGAECANELGGNDKFWAFIDRYFSLTPSNNQVDLAILPQIAESIGLEVNKFNTCVAAKRYEQKINDSIQDAQNAGAQGTPYSVVIAKDGKTYPISGAYSYNQVKAIIDQALQ